MTSYHGMKLKDMSNDQIKSHIKQLNAIIRTLGRELDEQALNGSERFGRTYDLILKLADERDDAQIEIYLNRAKKVPKKAQRPSCKANNLDG